MLSNGGEGSILFKTPLSSLQKPPKSTQYGMQIIFAVDMQWLA